MTQTAKKASIDWWLVTRTISGEVATSAAFDAIVASEKRLQDLGRRDIRLAFRSIVEGTWWVAALDEQLRSRLMSSHPQLAAAYADDRDRDVDGEYIQAFLWARNRHAHQLPFTTEHDDALAERRGGVLSKYSEELKWIRSVDYPPVEKRFQDPARQAIYDRLLANEPINATLHHCALWFNKAAGRDLEWEQNQQARARASRSTV